jgi:hypothetical protein
MLFEGEKLLKGQVFLSVINSSKRDTRTLEDDERSGCPKSHRTDVSVEEARYLVHSEI